MEDVEVHKLGGESLTGHVFHLLVKRRTCEAGEDETEKKLKDFWKNKRKQGMGAQKKKQASREKIDKRGQFNCIIFSHKTIGRKYKKLLLKLCS